MQSTQTINSIPTGAIMKNVTLYLHITKKNRLIGKDQFILLEDKSYSYKSVKNRLDKLTDLTSRYSISSPSLLDFWCKSGHKCHIEFGDTMPKSHWEFWDNKHCQFKGMKDRPITFENSELGQTNGFNPTNISKASKNSRKISFEYTGQDGSLAKILSCKYELYIKSICKFGGQTYETKIILDPKTGNNGNNIPFT
jgi:hypothetical protein